MSDLFDKNIERTELTISARSNEEALENACEYFGVPSNCLRIEQQGPEQYRAIVTYRDGRFKIKIVDRGDSARLEYLLPPIGRGKAVTVKDVTNALAQQRIYYGIDKRSIAVIVQEVAKSGKGAWGIEIAKSTPARNGIPSHIEFTYPEAFQSIKGRPEKGLFVRKGEVIGTYRPGALPENGVDIFGNSLPGEKAEDNTPGLGNGIEVSDEEVLRAVVTGNIEWTASTRNLPHGEIHVNPPVEISPDGFKATLTLFPPAQRFFKYTEKILTEVLQEYGVTEGVRVNDLPKICAYLNQKRQPIRNLLIAEGWPAEPGKDGRIEYAVSLQPEIGKLREDGSIDYKERGFLKDIEEDQEIARMIPPTPGREGKTVTGKTLPTQPGKPVKLKTGKNVALSADGLQLLAEREGVVGVSQDGGISVIELFEHKGDVDYSVGNLYMSGSISITGSVRGGFTVEAEGDVLIGGTVEGAQIVAGGSIGIGGGVAGKGKAVLRAGGSITALYIEGATVEAGGNIHVRESITHSRIFCRGLLQMEHGAGRISGGALVVRKKISAKDIGTSAGVDTQVTLGFTKEEYLEVQDLYERIEELKTEMNRPGTDDVMRSRFMAMIGEMNEQRVQRIRKIQSELSDTCIEISGTIYPPTLVTIGDGMSIIDQPQMRVRVFFDPERKRIAVVPLGESSSREK